MLFQCVIEILQGVVRAQTGAGAGADSALEFGRVRVKISYRAFMGSIRIALANLRVPTTPDDSVRLATAAVAGAGRQDAVVICFPECFVAGYRWPGQTAAPPDPEFLERA